MDLHTLLHPKEVPWKNSGFVWLLDVYDWDTVIVEQGVTAELSFGLNLCVAFFPCSIIITGDPVGVIQRQRSAYVSCLASDGCETIRLHHIKFHCVDNRPQNSTFKIQGSSLAIFNSSFMGCISSEDGGIIQSFDRSSVVIDLSTFSDSYSSGFGGAVAAYGGSVHVRGSSFSDVYAVRGGGAIWSSAYRRCYGFSQGLKTELEIESSKFSNCTTDGDGGAILVSSDETEVGTSNGFLDVAIHASTFFSCQSSGYGGAICFSGYSVTAELNSTVIYSCQSTNSGGAISTSNGVSLSLHRAVMHNNSASVFGGAIFASNRVSLSLDESVIRKNDALMCGGAISAINSVFLSLDRSWMHENVASGCGGAIAANYSDILLVDSVFNNNSALGFGGGAFFLMESLIFANGTSCTGNRAPAGGGGVILIQGSALPSSENIDHLCGQDNSAVYGPCVASECQSLNLSYNASGLVWAGLSFIINILKLDAYKQIILADSSSFLQILPSKHDKIAVEDPGAYFTLVGSSVSQFSRGMASIEVAIKPRFVQIKAEKKWHVSRPSHMFLYRVLTCRRG